ncbi:enoyl-CoA hydratase [Alicycliphilus denitrificans]|uniref:Enoyl-CoA hydratase n=1 Tax=Alicycliphilus denitrificans TaxID=179636 RepID=A0A858ZZ77_9BURK|nr:Enoyl-CoA hydratase/isomerase [Alicycliphilus denitrificans BC]QKD45957.1 enoyl-CoA hydratase [Alicycliphilus denitrificans]
MGEKAMYSQISYPTPATAVLTIADAGPLNVLSTPVIRALTAQLGELAENSELHCLVLRGSGSRAFIAGADIKEMAALTASTGRAFISALRDLCNAVRHFPVPVIVRLQGHTLGGGLELAMAGDLRIAADDAVVGMPEVKVGIPSVIHAAMMPAQIGAARAAWLLLTGENIPATQAQQWGLINECVPRDRLDERILEIAAGLAQIGPVVLRQQKRLLRRWECMTVDAAIDDSIAEFGEAFKTGEPQHHMNAFLERKNKRS